MIRIYALLFLIPNIVFGQQWQGFNVPFNYNNIYSSCYDTVNQYMYAVGNICLNNQVNKNHVEWYNGTKWDTLPGIFNNETRALAIYNNELYIGGYFNSVNGNASTGLVKWNGSSFSYYGNRLNSSVSFLKVIDNKLLIGGYFTEADTQTTTGLAWYDGTNFTPLPTNSYNLFQPYGAVLYDSMLVITGNIDDTLAYNIVCLKDGQWINFPAGGVLGSNSDIASIQLLNNQIYVGGYFMKSDGNAGNFIQYYDGTSWKDVGGGMTWNLFDPNSNGQIHCLKEHDGKLFAGGVFNYAGGIPANRLAVWENNKWCGLGTAFNNIGRVFSMQFYKDTLFIFGNFIEVNGIQALGIAKWLGGNYIDTCGNTAELEQFENNKSEIIVYPNPANDQITIEIPRIMQDAIISIYDITGQVVLKQFMNQDEIEIDIRNLANGMYILKVNNTDGIVKKKFVKE